MKKSSFVVLLLVGATVLGATVLREPIAWAAQAVDAQIIGPLDANGNVKVHEQGTASVAVVGDVSAKLAIPATQFSIKAFTLGDFVSTYPAGTNLAITSVTISNDHDTGLSAGVNAAYKLQEGPGDCGLAQQVAGIHFPVPAHDMRTVSFPQPWVFPASQAPHLATCLRAASAPHAAEFMIVGYSF